MKLQGRNPEFDLRPANVRLLQFELPLSGLNIPGEEVFQNRFSQGTREAVLEFQFKLDLEPSGVVERGIAKQLTRRFVGACPWIRQAIQTVSNKRHG